MENRPNFPSPTATRHSTICVILGRLRMDVTNPGLSNAGSKVDKHCRHKAVRRFRILEWLESQRSRRTFLVKLFVEFQFNRHEDEIKLEILPKFAD